MTACMTKTMTLGLLLALGIGGSALAAPEGPRDADRTEMREEIFNRFDADGDGQFTREDLEGLATSRFADADTDGDGFLSEEEIRAANTKRMADRAERMTSRMLERLDQDGDGQISFEEIAANGDRGDRMFERADADGDGVVTRAEFMEMEPPRGRPFGHQRN